MPLPVVKLVLIRHSLPAIDPKTPPAEWHLSPEGMKRCKPFADTLRSYKLGTVYHSKEPKAQETALAISAQLDLACHPWPDLHEHERSGSVFETQADFERKVEMFFNNPSKVVFGSESADQAYARFSRAVDGLIENHRPGLMDAVCAVSHGTVISLFVARRCRVDAITLWKRLKMPCALVLDSPGFSLVDCSFT